MENRRINRRYRIYSTRRFTFFIISAVVTLALVGYMVFAVTSNAQSEIKYDKVIVRSGDSVWNIAKKHVKGNYDIRHAVKVICDVNDIDSVTIYPGQLIMVPTYVY